MKVKIFKVKILKASKSGYWYADLIGKTFDVCHSEGNYGLAGHPECFFLTPCDCSIVEGSEKEVDSYYKEVFDIPEQPKGYTENRDACEICKHSADRGAWIKCTLRNCNKEVYHMAICDEFEIVIN